VEGLGRNATPGQKNNAGCARRASVTFPIRIQDGALLPARAIGVAAMMGGPRVEKSHWLISPSDHSAWAIPGLRWGAAMRAGFPDASAPWCGIQGLVLVVCRHTPGEAERQRGRARLVLVTCLAPCAMGDNRLRSRALFEFPGSWGGLRCQVSTARGAMRRWRC